MADIPAEVENLLTQLTTEEFNQLVAKTRPAADSRDPRIRAADALRQMRGADRYTRDRRGAGQRIDRDNPGASSKQEAVDAIRAVCGYKITTEDD